VIATFDDDCIAARSPINTAIEPRFLHQRLFHDDLISAFARRI
jgi:hypothetical protein